MALPASTMPVLPVSVTVPVALPSVDAVTVNAPSVDPANSVTRATPPPSVSAVPAGGVKPPVASLVVNLTTMFGAARPVVSSTRASA